MEVINKLIRWAYPIFTTEGVCIENTSIIADFVVEKYGQDKVQDVIFVGTGNSGAMITILLATEFARREKQTDNFKIIPHFIVLPKPHEETHRHYVLGIHNALKMEAPIIVIDDRMAIGATMDRIASKLAHENAIHRVEAVVVVTTSRSLPDLIKYLFPNIKYLLDEEEDIP